MHAPWRSLQVFECEGSLHSHCVLQADLSTGEGLQEAFDVMGPVDVVINCAAISSPSACEKHPMQARYLLT